MRQDLIGFLEAILTSKSSEDGMRELVSQDPKVHTCIRCTGTYPCKILHAPLNPVLCPTPRFVARHKLGFKMPVYGYKDHQNFGVAFGGSPIIED